MRGSQLGGKLEKIPNCYINIPSFGEKIEFYILPEISDSKSAVFADENGIGRSSPFTSYQYSEARQIQWQARFMVTNSNNKNSSGSSANGETIESLVKKIRLLEACVYPLTNITPGPYSPPPIVRLKCGTLISKTSENSYQNTEEIPAILKSYSVKFDTQVPWDETYMVPYKVDVDLVFSVVYTQSQLPGADRILSSGY